MANISERWVALGVSVSSNYRNPIEDPEGLILDSLPWVGKHEEPRLLGFLVSWIAIFGHLIIVRKLRFKNEREVRLFSAIIEESKTKEKKLLQMVTKTSDLEPEVLEEQTIPVLVEVAKKDPLQTFLRHGFIVKRPGRTSTLVRPNIILPLPVVFQRSLILKNRALYGPNLRTDLGTVLPRLKEISGRQLARLLHVAPQTLHGLLKDFERSQLIECYSRGRSSLIRWHKYQTTKNAA